MVLSTLVVTILTIVLLLAFCYLLMRIVEKLFGQIDATIKSILGVIILCFILLYLLGHFGVLTVR